MEGAWPANYGEFSSSPGRASTASLPELLTPRSKVAKMLAEIDNAATPPSVRSNDQAASANDKALKNNEPRTETSQSPLLKMSKNAQPFQSDDDDDDDEEVRRPIGRAARRMYAGPADPHHAAHLSPRGLASSPVRPIPNNLEDDLYSATPRTAKRPTEFSTPSISNQGRSSLFVTPAKSGVDDDADDLPELPLLNNGRLAELVAQKRLERLAREEREHEGQLEKRALSSDIPQELLEDPQEASNPEIDRIMSDAAKPTRKASRKALLEMERETQRLARQQALTHQMKVKKKFTTSGLLARFNYRPAIEENTPLRLDSEQSISSAPHSDRSEPAHREPLSTPPSSPPTPLDRQRALVEKGALSKLVLVREDTIASLASVDEEMPSIAAMLSPSNNTRPVDGREQETKKGLILARLGKKPIAITRTDSSDDELEIIQRAEVPLTMFDKAKRALKGAKADSHAIHALKHLAHIGTDAAPARRGGKSASRPSMNPAVLEAQLRSRAKEQARAQQLERIAELKAKGIDVQTSEEREREAEEFENLLEKARQDAVALRKAEKAAAREDGGAIANPTDDESEDEDWKDSGDESDRPLTTNDAGDELIDNAAEESDEEEEEEEEEEGEDDEDDDNENPEEVAQDSNGEENLEPAQRSGPQPPSHSVQHAESHVQDLPMALGAHENPENTSLGAPVPDRKVRRSRVIVDDDDEESDDDIRPVPTALGGGTQEGETSEPDPFAAFNFDTGNEDNFLLSPTQAFKATMQTPTQSTPRGSIDVLQQQAPPIVSSLPSVTKAFRERIQNEDESALVHERNVPDSQRDERIWEAQAPETPLPSSKTRGSAIGLDTPGWEPSQDIGLPASWQATKSAEEEAVLQATSGRNTQSTVRLRISESPVPASSMAKRRRITHRQGAIVDSSDEEDSVELASQSAGPSNAWREMARKRKEALSAAELETARREMKGMMDEQAEESEDEYAGLGGDDYVAPETEQDRAMIDSSHVDVDEHALAAHFAERQRIDDEAEASKLYKDLMTGALRRKQANMFDLAEDEDDIAIRRRQMRQREEARKRKLLLQDENIAGLAEGKPSKGKDAFLKAIADDDDGGEEEYIEIVDPDVPSQEQTPSNGSQASQDAGQPHDALQEISGNKRSRDVLDDDERRPAKQRRIQASAFRAPASFFEVKESVSFLLDEADRAKFGPSVLELDSDDEDGQKEDGMQTSDDDGQDGLEAELARENDGGFAPDPVSPMPPPRLPASQRRTPAKAAVVDRLSLKRGASTSETTTGRTAWGSVGGGTFKVPSLLRRATTNVATGANERGVTTFNGVSRENSGVKMGGSRKSSLAYQARADERKAQVEAIVRRRAENTARIAQLRRGSSSSLGSGLAGQFE